MTVGVGVVLDIDGVLLRGGKVIPGAPEAIQRLVDNKIPFVFVTNGGGTLEERKAHDLSKKLSADIHGDQIILCHTPFRSLVSEYGDKSVLVIGREECTAVARHYGFRHIVTPRDLFETCTDVLPVRKIHHVHKPEHDTLRENISAALIFHDPVDWTLDMQVLSDVVMPRPGSDQLQKPLFASNADIVYATEYSLPRFTQGAFVESFRHLYQLHHETPLHVTYYGKPFPIQYHYAKETLMREAERLSAPKPIKFFAVGDNPKSDIRGANAAGEDWHSILVRTGLFQSENENDVKDPADHVCLSIVEAVDYILSFHAAQE